MHQIDIREKEDKYIVIFEIPGVRERNIIIKSEQNSLNVIAVNNSVTMDMKNIDFDALVYNKTVILENADFKNMTHTFFAGWLEVIIPKKTKE